MSSIYGCRSPPEIPESTVVLSTKDLKVTGAFVLALNFDGALMMAHGEYLAGQKDQRSDTVDDRHRRELYRRSNGRITVDDLEVNFDGGRDRIKEDAQSRLTSI
jgi:hypothetical protein